VEERQLIATGKEFNEEIDKARRDEKRGRGGSGQWGGAAVDRPLLCSQLCPPISRQDFFTD
jgi:hypothetical protein